MARVILGGQGGGKSTKDATATAADIREGLTAYIASGKVTGKLTVSMAEGTFNTPGSSNNTPVTVSVGFKPYAVFVQRTAANSDTNFQNTILRYGDVTKSCTNGMSYSALASLVFTDDGFSASISSSSSISWTWFAIGW